MTDNLRSKWAVTALIVALGLVCIGLAGLDFKIHRHVTFSIEETPTIYALFGFATYAAIVFLAKGLRRLISRPEDYYGGEATDCESEAAAGTEPAQEADHA